jgi:predicted AAA+ superfamily ATPase
MPLFRDSSTIKKEILVESNNSPLLCENIIIGGITGSGKTKLAKYLLENVIKAEREVHLMTQDSEILPREYAEYDSKAFYYWFPVGREREYIDTFYKLSQQNFRENSFILIDEFYPSLIDEDLFADFAISLKELNSQIIVVTQSLEIEIDLLSGFSYLAIPKHPKDSAYDAQAETISDFESEISIHNRTWSFHKIKDVIAPLFLRTGISTV